MKTAIARFLVLISVALVSLASAAGTAYSAQDLHADCKHAETLLANEPGKKAELFDTLAGSRCSAYLQGFVGGYTMSERLARQVGVEFVAFCLPQDVDTLRLVRAVLTYLALYPLPPERLAAISADQITTAALARAFACAPADE